MRVDDRVEVRAEDRAWLGTSRSFAATKERGLWGSDAERTSSRNEAGGRGADPAGCSLSAREGRERDQNWNPSCCSCECRERVARKRPADDPVHAWRRLRCLGHCRCGLGLGRKHGEHAAARSRHPRPLPERCEPYRNVRISRDGNRLQVIPSITLGKHVHFR